MITQKKDEAFFWQRLTHVNFDIIKKVFGDLAVKIHLHKAIDPGQELMQPSKEEEKKFQISYSDWFETRSEMLEVIKNKAIYVAPREYEGIGMSFLEAMALGKAVVAVDNPTMNEYIKHKENGYLFDLFNPQEVDFSEIEKVQKNTYNFMKKGREKWEKEKIKIVEFIKK
jgi:glycosyltransferase involved in cell wall biosynthesis